MMRIVFLFADGTEAEADSQPVRISLQRDEDTPADSLELTYTPSGPLLNREPCGVRMERGGTVLFSGILDEHSVRTSGGVRTEFFALRSRAAALLDNEAQPGQLRMPSLRLIETLFLLPFGLRAEGGDFRPKAGEFVVEKGTSCWEAVCGFSSAFLHRTPHCLRDGTLCFSERAAKTLRLAGVQETELLHRPYARLSRIVVQNTRTGAYNTVYENPAAAGVSRVRYLSAYARTAPETLIADGEREALRLRVVCAGFADAEPGDLYEAAHLSPMCGSMRLTALRYRCTDGAEETTLTFEPSEVSEKEGE
ncbi:MAG: hypothetical protein ACI4GO_05500 [Hominenteromicrobium sp.]